MFCHCLCDWLSPKAYKEKWGLGSRAPVSSVFCGKHLGSHSETLERFPGVGWPLALVLGYFLASTVAILQHCVP